METVEVKPMRRMRKKRLGKLPPPAVAVRGLWAMAAEEEKEKAHRAAGSILEYWLGRASKAEVASRLAVTPLRVWQLSQQALSGMVAGLLKQPRTRRKGEWPVNPEEDPKKLRKRIADLETQLRIATDLVNLLREMPGNREGKSTPPVAPWKKKKKVPAKDSTGSGSVAAREGKNP